MCSTPSAKYVSATDAPPWRRRYHHLRGLRRQSRDPGRAVGELDPDQHVGHGRGEPVDVQRSPAQRLQQPQAPGPDRRVIGAPGRQGRDLLARAREHRREREPHLAHHRRLPEHFELTRRQLAQLQIRRPHFVRERGREQHREQGERGQADGFQRSVPLSKASAGREQRLRTRGRLHVVLLEQAGEIRVLGRQVFFAPPFVEKLCAHFLEGSRPAAVARRHLHQVQAELRLDRTLPRARFDAWRRARKPGPELARDRLLVDIGERRRQERRITQRGGIDAAAARVSCSSARRASVAARSPRLPELK